MLVSVYIGASLDPSKSSVTDPTYKLNIKANVIFLKTKILKLKFIFGYLGYFYVLDKAGLQKSGSFKDSF